jgi:1-acyl-sn-glycerol-3-phosphate acyltransferase
VYYRLGRLLLHTYLRLRNGLEFHGLEKVPEGPVILACNHASYMDPVLVSLAFPEPRRRVRWMAWDALFRVPVLNFLVRRLGAFPVVPDKADRSAFAAAVEILREGGIVGIFPEAGRTPDGAFQTVKPGFARLAARAGAAIVPVVIRGSFEAWPMHKLLPGSGQLHVHFLPPIYHGQTELDKSAQYELCAKFESVQRYSHGDQAHFPEGT